MRLTGGCTLWGLGVGVDRGGGGRARDDVREGSSLGGEGVWTVGRSRRGG